MANAGSIGFGRMISAPSGRPGALTGGARATSGQVAGFSNRRIDFLPATSMSGSTSIGGVINPNRVVRAYNRTTGALLKRVVSDGSGLFSIRGLPLGADAYFVVLEQQAGDAGSYNLAAFDHVTQT